MLVIVLMTDTLDILGRVLDVQDVEDIVDKRKTTTCGLGRG